MYITKHTDYAFRVLIYLAAQSDDKRITIQEISKFYDISKNHLMKVVQELSNMGFINTTRGAHGGMKLAIAPHRIQLSSIIAYMESTLISDNNLHECDPKTCNGKNCCELKILLSDAQQSYMSHLTQYSIADIIPERWRNNNANNTDHSITDAIV